MTRLLPIVVAALVACVIAIAVSIAILEVTDAWGNQSPIAGDPKIYEARVNALVDGGVPYLDTTLEHLPVAVVPMIAVRGVASATGADYAFLWAVAMTCVFVATVAIWAAQPSPDAAGARFLVVSLPLLPLVLYRVEPWVVLLAVISIVLAARRAWVGSAVMAGVATLAKGWPIVLFAYPWRADRRRLTAITLGITVAILAAVSIAPGFREGRAFSGIHTETILGNLTLVLRHLTGADLGIDMAAGAAYMAVPAVIVAANLAIGAWFFFGGIMPALRSAPMDRLPIPLGLAVLGILLASPLFSAQFVYWLTPFVIFLGARDRWIFFAIATLSTASMVWWEPASMWWAMTVLVRNILLLVLAIRWYRHRFGGDPTPATPLRSEQLA